MKIPSKILNQTWSIDKLNIQGDSIQIFWTRHEVDKLNIQGDSIQVLNQIWRTDKLNIQGDSIQIKCSRPEYSWKIARWLLNTNQSIN